MEYYLLNAKPQPFTIVDIIIWAKMMSFDLSGNLFDEIKRYKFLIDRNLTPERIDQLWPAYPEDAPTVVPFEDYNVTKKSTRFPYDEENKVMNQHRLNLLREKQHRSKNTQKKNKKSSIGIENDPYFKKFFNQESHHLKTIGSNNWVVNGSFTSTKLPYMLNDPHLTLTAPSVWMMMSLESNDYRSLGACFPGVPGIGIINIILLFFIIYLFFILLFYYYYYLFFILFFYLFFSYW